MKIVQKYAGALLALLLAPATPALAQGENNGNHYGFTNSNGNHYGFELGTNNPNGTPPVTTVFKTIPLTAEMRTTWVTGINNRGVVCGNYYDSASRQHGFIYYNGVMKTVDAPGHNITSLEGIAADDSVGGTADGAYSFVRLGTTYYDLALYEPFSYGNAFEDISQSGTALTNMWRWYGVPLHFTWNAGVFTPLPDPTNLPPGNGSAYIYYPRAINSAGTVLAFLDYGDHYEPGLHIGTTFSPLAPAPVANDGISSFGIVDTGDVYITFTQSYQEPLFLTYRYAPSTGTYTRITNPDDTTGTAWILPGPGAVATRADGQVFMAGHYRASATAPLVLFIAGPSDAEF